MSSDSRKDREKMKEAYKKHYRKMREAKERLARSRKTKNITDALKEMDTTALTETFDEFLYKVKSKITSVEARLEVAMDSLAESDEELMEQELDEEMKKQKAKETLRQAKIEMGLLYNEIEQQAQSMQIKKTIGTEKKEDQNRTKEDRDPGQQKDQG